MKKLFALFAVLPLLMAGSLCAQTGPVELGRDPAVTIAGRNLPPGDARVEKARAWLKKVAGATGEIEEQVAASSMKLARFLGDTAGIRAQPMETLEGLAVQATPGKALGDMTAAYFQARSTAPNKSHAEALVTLTAKK
jgi:hypothetical protein